MNQESKSKLVALRDLLSAVNPYPWQDHVVPWTEAALPLFVEHYPKHVEGLRELTKEPQMGMRPRKTGGFTRFDPVVEPSHAAVLEYERKAQETCVAAQQRILFRLDFLIGLTVD